MTEQHVRIVMRGHGQGEVFVGGRKVENVTAVNFSSAVGEVNCVSITTTLHPTQVEITGVSNTDEVKS